MPPINRLFVVNKPIFQGSNSYMGYVKRKYDTKKVGFSGTLDPFATGCLIVATGQYTKLFQYLKKAPKVYNATLWLGVNSPTLDIEKVDSIIDCPEFTVSHITSILDSLKGNIDYYPPKYSAKKIGGKRAYELARAGQSVELSQISSTIHEIELLNYSHPFVHFRAKVSEGTYIRSLGVIISDKLGVDGTLSSLHRQSEGNFHYQDEEPIDPFANLKIPTNEYTGDDEYIELGKKLEIGYFKNRKDGVYLIETKNFYSIIEIDSEVVKYRFNRIPKYIG